ncbi:MAG: DUF4124 domain-containing protein [Gammaproteobacteria bacterium]|nr:DUF4124 domain-containing protein [Gammaproteobacteria bacterium]
MKKNSIGLWLLLLLPLLANAEIYKGIDADGHVMFSDRPMAGSEPIKLKPVTTYTYKAPVVKRKLKSDKHPTDFVYQKLTLLSPLNKQTIRSQEGIVNIQFSTVPALKKKKGHFYQIILDDKVLVDELTEAQYALSNIDRGEHRLSIRLLDSDGKLLIESEQNIFYIRKHSVLFRKPG